ncbi:MAG: hypothetical protein IJG33_16125 [Selenomonadaceae bacterium]|nr:hypothetical protein [Selenomonadaceae bacterium]
MEMTRQEVERILNKLTKDLTEDNKKKLRDLESRVAEEFRGKDKFIEIVTDVLEAENLFSVECGGSIFFANQPSLDKGEPRTLHSEPFFLCVPYDEFDSLLKADYQGAGFTYQLKPNYRFVAAEERFYRIARLYGVPVQVYSPYARRAVDVCIFGEVSERDLRLAENNLAGKLMTNHELYWNVAIDSVMWDSVSLDGEYRCTVEDDLSFVLPTSDAAIDDELDVRREGNQIVFRTSRSLLLDKVERIKILPQESKIASRLLSKQRLRTQGDIEFVLSGLARDGYSCRFGSFGATAGNISRYAKEHEYFTSADENLLRAKSRLPVCTVKFSGDEIFLTDYANFVLNFLTETYPEFNWAGERGD